MITGRRAFPAEDFLEGITERVAGLLPTLKQHLQRLPHEWGKAIEWCLRTDPSERPDSARAVIEILDSDSVPPVLRKRAKAARPLKLSRISITALAESEIGRAHV